MKRFAVAMAGALFLAACSLGWGAELFVATDGNDDGPGTESRPFATVQRARDAVRRLSSDRSPEPGGVIVWIRGGAYPIEQTLHLTVEDSGTETSPIAYRAWPNEEVRLSGGKAVSGFKPVEASGVLERLAAAAHGSVLQADLKALGVTGLGELPIRFRDGGGWPELFFNGSPQQLARWPNDGFVTIESVIDRGSTQEDRGGTFVYSGDRPGGWNTAEGVWLHGYWCHDWSDECIKIRSIDVPRRRITLAAAHGYGIGPSSSWNTDPRRYYAVNLLEELDRPGEWYLDAKGGVLYFWPPEPTSQARVELSLLKEPLISLENVSHVTLEGLTLETSRGDGVTISGGTANRVAGCTLRNLAGYAVSINGGTRHGVLGCDLYQLGQGGIRLEGGDRPKLLPAEHYASNNHIHHFGRLQKTYAAGIHVGGVGNRVANNLIHHAPHSAILYGGNEHTIELNEIHDVALETSDVGAFYTGRDWTSRGNVLRYNYIHDLPSFGACGTMGIYLDDCDSGDRLIGNVFYRAGRAAFIGGGRDNLVENNLFIDCDSAVHIDARGLTRIKLDSPGGRDSWDLLAKAQRLDYQNPPWSTRYPKLATIMEEEHQLPLGNVIRRNVAVGCKKWLNAGGDVRPHLDRVVFEDNLVLEGEDPGFVDAATGDFRLRGDSIIPGRIPGFQPIPFDQIGLVRDAYRAGP